METIKKSKIIVGVNGWFLSYPFTGIGKYLRNLLKFSGGDQEKNAVYRNDEVDVKLSRYNWQDGAEILLNEIKKIAKCTGEDCDLEFVIFVREKLKFEIEGVNFVTVPEKKIPFAGVRKLWWEQFQIPKKLKDYGVDVAWFPNTANPWRKKFYSFYKVLVTVHDCIPWKDERYNNGFLSHWKNSMTRAKIALADKVFTVSDTSKMDVAQICKVPESKISVIYNAVDEDIFNKFTYDDEHEVLERFSFGNDFYLYVGGYDPRKNVDLLLKEWRNFINGNSSFLGDVWNGEKLMLVAAKQNGRMVIPEDLQESVVATGYVSDQELAVLYRNAVKFVNLSGDEGFNVPVLEALLCGRDVLLSDIPVHREIYGGVDGVKLIDISKLK